MIVSAKEKAKAHILQKVMAREFAPNGRISELRLSKELGISRAPIREALREIASRGFVQFVPGFGAYMNVPKKEELANIFACREALETKAAHLAATRITPSQLVALRESLRLAESLYKSARDGGAMDLDERHAVLLAESDLLLHRTVLEAAHNPQLARMLTEMHLIQRTWTQKLDYRRFSVVKTLACTHREHKAIVEAMESRSPRRAFIAMSRHVRRSARRFLWKYDEKRGSALRCPPGVLRLLLDMEANSQS